MTPFEKFFAGEWQQLLETVRVPGMADPSWDRKAAYLYWNAMGFPAPTDDDEPEPPKRRPKDMDDLL